MEVTCERLQMFGGISSTYRILTKQLKDTERTLKRLTRHHALQSLEFCLGGAITTVPDGLSKLFGIIDSMIKVTKANAV
ncbi:hypothetical protein [Vreelandella massiliensis]|uniref:hypothetical protein n=1 Tax=Vreelandella massiliensis TaxID=1816686 RepID=UPI00096A4500|nr:hypothetical protein [Halomonas massiliensis]